MQAEAAHPGPQATDLFVALNVFLFAALCGLVYADRIGRSATPGNAAEFFLYASFILAIILVAWWKLRRLPHPPGLLALVEIGILAHFAGAFVSSGGGRLYDASFAGIGYDKLVHLYNGFAGAALIDHWLGLSRSPVPARRLLVFGLLMGAGALFELLEYGAVLTVPDTGVGDYANNMRDLAANAVGAAVFAAASPIAKIARAPVSRRR